MVRIAGKNCRPPIWNFEDQRSFPLIRQRSASRLVMPEPTELDTSMATRAVTQRSGILDGDGLNISVTPLHSRFASESGRNGVAGCIALAIRHASSQSRCGEEIDVNLARALLVAGFSSVAGLWLVRSKVFLFVEMARSVPRAILR